MQAATVNRRCKRETDRGVPGWNATDCITLLDDRWKPSYCKVT